MEKIEQAPLISVVIPLYNKEKVLLKTLESVRKQTFINYEVVIVNDGSTDRSLEMVSNYFVENDTFSNQSNIRLISQVNSGVSAARNIGIKESKGEYIAFLDADDEWLPDYLSTIYFLLRKYPECDVFGTQYFYKEPEQMYEANIKGFSFASQDGLIDNYFEMAVTGRPPLWTSAVVVHKEALLAVGGFPNIKMGEDLIVWAKLACNYKIAYYKKALSVYTRIPENYSTGAKSANSLLSPKNDVGGEFLFQLAKNHPLVRGLKRYCFLWHKMRFVMLVGDGRKKEAFVEYIKTWPYGLLNLDCYYRLFLNLLPCQFHAVIKQVIGKP